MGDTFNLPKVLNTLKKSWKLIALLTIIAAIGTAGVSHYLLTPVYGSSAQILVSQEISETNLISTQSIETDLQLINTYRVIIKNPIILGEVIEELELDTTVEELEKDIIVTAASGSQVIDLTAMHTDPATAVLITNTTARIFEKKVQEVLNLNNVMVLSEAVMKPDPAAIAPNTPLNIAMAAAIGLMLGVGIAFVREYMDTTIKNESDIEDLLDAPILAIISPIPDRKKGKEIAPETVKKKEVVKYG